MEIPQPDGQDVDRGTKIFIGCWVLTAFVFCVLVFRYAVKAWVAWLLPTISRPERVWGLEDVFYALGYGFDVAHMTLVWRSHKHGLGRHYYYLSDVDRVLAMKWDFTSQPLAVAAAMLSRTGVILFLYTCFAQNRKSLRIIVIVCLVVQVVANLFTILQIVLQCGPHPYRVVNRITYFHYMWDSLPSDGSVECQSPSVQATVGYVQGGFNSIIDFTLTYLAGFEIWQFLLRRNNNHSGQSLTLYRKFKRLDPSIRGQRLWQTLLICGPLLLSGISSIVKTYLLSALSSRSDFTWNIVPFVLWVKIEDYCIPIATAAPILRLFVRSFIEHRSDGTGTGGRYGTTGSGNGSGNRSRGGRTITTTTTSKSGAGIELMTSSRTIAGDHDDKSNGFVHMRDADDEISDSAHNGSSLNGSEKELVAGIMVKQEYEVRIEEADSMPTAITTTSGGGRTTTTSPLG